jgi:lysophospholipase L1-like esterase
MGGKNSMPSWVSANPPMAAKDYTHLSPRGARIVSEMLYNALVFEYNNYKTNNLKQ